MSHLFTTVISARVTWQGNAPYSLDFQEPYYGKDNALEGARAVFIEGNDLVRRFQSVDLSVKSSFVIAETGFGSGLNFLLTWATWREHAPKSAQLFFISTELHPLLKDDLAQCLALWPNLSLLADDLKSAYPILTPGMHTLSFDEGRVTLILIFGDALASFKQLLHSGLMSLEHSISTTSIDAWYLDGFSPEKNPLLWSLALFKTIAVLSNEETTLATYFTDSLVVEGLSAGGFHIEKRKGLASKFQMLVAKSGDYSAIKLKPSTPWHLPLKRKKHTKHAIIIGAGLAGCLVAHALQKRQWQIDLLEADGEVGAGASGNPRAVLFPKLSAYHSPMTDFMLMAYLFALRYFNKLDIGTSTGLLQLAYNDEEIKSQHRLRSWLSDYPTLGKLVSAAEASSLAGVPLSESALYVAHSRVLDSKALCQHLVKSSLIHLALNTLIPSIAYEQGLWHVGQLSAPVLILAQGWQSNQFPMAHELPIQSVYGQMTAIEGNEHSRQLKIPLCGEGHILPEQQGMHFIGATFHQELRQYSPKVDNQINLKKLASVIKSASWSNNIVGHWAGIRGATPDYLPLVGPVPEVNAFLNQFAKLALDSNRFIAAPGTCHPGLFTLSGLGSRGLTTGPIAAEWLAGYLNHEPSILPRTLIQALSPARFLRRQLIRS